MVPLQVMNTLNKSTDLPRIKKLIVGGAEISTDLEKLLQKLLFEVYATYGMSETCSHVAVRRLNGPDHQMDYHALPGITLARDDRDCLVIKADYLPDTIVTNDLVEFTSSVSFKWLGRYDNLINSGGIKIVPEEVEAIVAEKMGLECAVIGLPDEKLGHKLVFVFEKKRTSFPLPELKTFLEKQLPRHIKPKEIILVEKFPRNNSLKIDRIKIKTACAGCSDKKTL
jgi:O-succinylbenzoic acid--CoA ligase